LYYIINNKRIKIYKKSIKKYRQIAKNNIIYIKLQISS
jgi:hypothetical protein